MPPEDTDGETTQNWNEFFDSIGSKVDSLSPALNGDAPGKDEHRPPVEEVESLCMNCGHNGITRLLLTAIPYFREAVIMSFSCEYCHTQNNEIQAAGTVQPKGIHYELRLTSIADLSRQVIKSDTATVKFIELDLEIPAGRGQLTNVEGLLMTVVEDLETGQETRKEQMPDAYPKVAEIIANGRAMLAGDVFPFRIYVDDPAGNSFIAPDLKDGVGKWEKREYTRTPEQNAALGLGDSGRVSAPTVTDDDLVPSEVYSFPASCPGCMHACTTHMKMVDIPHFKQVVLMSTVCDDCGYRSNDIKTGGEIPERGERITLTVDRPADLARDILKSETCALDCPELQLQVNPGTLGGRFTTVEGLLKQVRNDLHGQIFGTADGDSFCAEDRAQWHAFFAALDAAIRGDTPFTLVMSDPLASSFVQPLTDPPASDHRIVREAYDRSADEDDELGLADMKTEGYAPPEKLQPASFDRNQQTGEEEAAAAAQ